MEARRIFWNKKSVLLLITFLFINMGLFYYSVLQEYVPLASEEVKQINYTKKYDEINRQIEKLKHVPIFQIEDIRLENDKIQKDYGKLSSVCGKTHQSEGISLWFGSSVSNYLTLFFCIWLVFITFDIEKKGLFPLVYATKGGRGVLAAKHLLYYFLAALGGSVLFQGSLLAMACVKAKNVSALFLPIQFVNGLETCILPVNGIEFFLLVVLVSACGIFVVTLFCLMILLMIHNSKIALTICGILFVMEYFLYQWLPSQSQWSIFKYINILTLLSVNPLYREYHLYTLGGVCFEIKEGIYLSMLVLGLILSVCCLILASKRRPYYQKHFLEKAIHLFLCQVRRGLCKLPGRVLEWHKVLISQRGLFILIFFFLILIKGVWQPMSEGEQLTLGNTEEYMKDFYEQWTGPVTEKINAEVEKRKQWLEYLIEEDNPTASYYSNGLKTVEKRLAYIRKHKEQKLWLVNPSGYRYLFGKKGEVHASESTLLVLFCLAALTAGIFTYEKKSSMEFLLCSTPKGRRHLQKRKFCMIFILVIFLWLVLSSMEFYNVLQTYPLGGFRAPIQSLPFMNKVPMKMEIWQYCFLTYFIRLAWLFMIAMIYCEIAIWFKNQEISILLCGVSLLPSVLYLMGIESFSYFSLTKLIHVSHFFRQGYWGIGKEAAAFTLIALILFVSVKCRRRLLYVKN